MEPSAIDFSKVSKIYYGVDSGCRCGCKGNYAYPGSPIFTRYKNAILKCKDTLDVSDPISWINFSLPKNKAYTVYFN